MSEVSPEDLHDEDIPVEPAEAERPDPEEYEPDETTRGVSAATGTIYGETGEPEATPHDLAPAEEEELP